MKLSLFDDHRLGVWGRDDTIIDVTGLIEPTVRPKDRMNALIEGWDRLAGDVSSLVHRRGTALANVTLRAPQPRPTKIIAAPVNHFPHLREMDSAGMFDGAARTIETYVGFLKAPSSIIGPDRAIELPYADRRVDHEGELGVIIGRRARCVSRLDALDYVFGYVPLLDITMRGEEDRPFRKSFDTFTPLGPAIVTADEITDPGSLDLRLEVNATTRQHGNTRDLIYDIPRLIEVYSEAMTLEPGDIIASGTTDGVGQIHPGDEITFTIEPMPSLTVIVLQRQPASVASERERASSLAQATVEP